MRYSIFLIPVFIMGCSLNQDKITKSGSCFFPSNDPQLLPNLYVKSGTACKVSPRLHTLNSFVIEKGGVLTVESNARSWAVFHVKGNTLIHGKIVFREFASIKGPVTAKLPNGKLVSHEFAYDGYGGDGADGGSLCSGNGVGGTGADGTSEYGGGGGGGNAYRKHPRGEFNGSPGRQHRGGRGGWTAGSGGNGARRSKFGNGGLIAFYAESKFNGSGGEIDLDGSPGDNGGNGGGGFGRPGWPCGSAGGGGGGAPGGNGGVLMVRANRLVNEITTVHISGGSGGQGGNGGMGTSSGGQGDEGNIGNVDYKEF